jgi:hypothetical protein
MKTDHTQTKGYHFISEILESFSKWFDVPYFMHESGYPIETCYGAIESPFMRGSMIEFFNLRYFIQHSKWPEGFKTKADMGNKPTYTQGEITKQGIVMLSEYIDFNGKLVLTQNEFKYFYYDLDKI